MSKPTLVDIHYITDLGSTVKLALFYNERHNFKQTDYMHVQM